MAASKESREPSSQALAILVARVHGLTTKIEEVTPVLPKRAETPFLYRQLDDALRRCQSLIEGLLPDVKRRGGGAAADEKDGKPKRGLFGRRKSRRNVEEPPPPTSEDSFSRTFLETNAQTLSEGLQGNSWTIPVPELLGFLGDHRKSGVLWIHGPDENFLIELKDGDLVHAASDHTPQGLRLGEILVARGCITQPQLNRFLEEKGTGLLGGYLRDKGLISDDALHESLAHQVQHIFHRLLGAEKVIFRFQEGMQLMMSHRISLNITQLLLESARVLDESSIPEEVWAERDMASDSLDMSSLGGAEALLDSALAETFTEDFADDSPEETEQAEDGNDTPEGEGEEAEGDEEDSDEKSESEEEQAA